MKYAVITSQYMGNCVSFAVLFDEKTFQDEVQAFLAEAEQYKRGPQDQTRPAALGDFHAAYYKPGRSRYVVNDVGGNFYIRFADTANRTIDISAEKSAHAQRHWPKPSAKDKEAISNHHSY